MIEPTAEPFDSQTLVELFAEAAEVLHRPGALDPKFAWMARAARTLTDARMAAYVEFRNGVPDVVAASGAPAPVVQQLLERFAPDLVDHVRRHGEPGHLSEQAIEGEWSSMIALPVPSVTGRTRGAVVLVLRSGTPAEAAGWVISGLALHLGTALDNTTTIARLAELEANRQEVVERLQDAVRPPLPTTVDAELGVHYQPADPGAPVGGDLYDWCVLPDGDLHCAVVDVTGQGVTATKDALAVTHAVRVLVLEDCPLREVVARADRVLSDSPSPVIATLAVARYTPGSGRLRLVAAGHPPAVLVTPDGRVEFLDARGVPIGYPDAGSLNVVERELEHNQALILYTDGIIEATRNVERGLADLKAAAGEVASYPARFLARGLVERALAGARHRDDSLVLVLRHRAAGPAPAVLGPFSYRFSPNSATVPLARHLFADWLDYQPVDRVHRDDLLFVATELCTNSIRASSGAPTSLELRARVDGDAVIIEVEDDGEGYTLGPRLEAPEPELEKGRGLFLVDALTDELSVSRHEDRTITQAVKRAAIVPAGVATVREGPLLSGRDHDQPTRTATE